MFSDTVHGAQASTNLYSLIETAKANGREPYAYLRRVFTLLPQATTVADIEALLPWVKTDWRRKVLLLVWAGTFLLFYGTYECTRQTWWYLRFILPGLPALGIAAVLVLQQINYPSWFLASRLLPPDASPDQLARGRIAQVPTSVLLFLAAAGWMLSWDRDLRVTKLEIDDRAYRITADWVAKHLPPEAVLVANQVSGAVMFYTNQAFISPNLLTAPDHLRLNVWLKAQHRVLYAALYPHEESVIREHLPGRWEAVTQLRQDTIWRRIEAGEPSVFIRPRPSNHP